jgi:hypothetical protein
MMKSTLSLSFRKQQPFNNFHHNRQKANQYQTKSIIFFYEVKQ